MYRVVFFGIDTWNLNVEIFEHAKAFHIGSRALGRTLSQNFVQFFFWVERCPVNTLRSRLWFWTMSGGKRNNMNSSGMAGSHRHGPLFIACWRRFLFDSLFAFALLSTLEMRLLLFFDCFYSSFILGRCALFDSLVASSLLPTLEMRLRALWALTSQPLSGPSANEQLRTFMVAVLSPRERVAS